jgi:hypothetical protein
LSFWQKCVWVGAAIVVVVSLLVLSQTAETSSPRASSGSQAEYYTIQDNNRSEIHYVVRDGDRRVIYNSEPNGR